MGLDFHEIVHGTSTQSKAEADLQQVTALSTSPRTWRLIIRYLETGKILVFAQQPIPVVEHLLELLPDLKEGSLGQEIEEDLHRCRAAVLGPFSFLDRIPPFREVERLIMERSRRCAHLDLDRRLDRWSRRKSRYGYFARRDLHRCASTSMTIE